MTLNNKPDNRIQVLMRKGCKINTNQSRWMNKFSLLVFSLVSYAASATQEIQFKIVDQIGNPIANAVVSASGEPTDDIANIPVMDQINSQFSPHVLVVQKNQSVRFPNSDDIRHHIYSFSQPKPFEIRLYKGEDSTPIRFDKSGVVVLGCNIHDQMLGYIYIAENEITAVTDQNGLARLRTQATEFTFWHANLSASNSERVTKSFAREHAQANENTKSTINRVSEFKTVTLALLEKNKTEVKRRKFSRKFSSREQ
ncbi:methylamine utilization protein [Paraglaciecola mesophila]|uniref:Methylamine utilization protein n=1 Tax=Paraglaciecola mesophila TaxID=197222 RepID=A0ABU9SZM8_9ALTE